jgi:hypothetical protein
MKADFVTREEVAQMIAEALRRPQTPKQIQAAEKRRKVEEAITAILQSGPQHTWAVIRQLKEVYAFTSGTLTAEVSVDMVQRGLLTKTSRGGYWMWELNHRSVQA